MHLRTFSSKVFVLLALLMFVGSGRAAEADTITLMWDSNPEPAVAGYIVHVGTQPATYTQHIDVGLSTTYAFPSAVGGQQYCFAVSAYFAGPVEGAKSSEVCGYSNRLPTLVNPGSRTSQVSQATSLQLQGADPDGQPVTYSATGLPAGLTLQSSTGFISGTPTTAGSFTVNATVSDGVLTASDSFTWTITAPDVTAPTVTITGPTSATTYTTTTSTVTLTGSAADNVAVTQVTWVNDRGGSGTASGTTNWSAATVALQTGANVLTVTARDAAGNTASDVLTVTYTVSDTTAPAVTITGPTSAATHTMTGTTVALSGTASDNVGVLQVTWANNRGGSGTATGTTTWTVSAVALQTGANVVTVTARDAAGNTASDVLTVTVNGAPTLTNPGAPSSTLAQSTSLQLAGSDPNGDTLTYSVTALPPGFSLTASNGLIAGTPVMTGSYPVTATVSDGTMTASQTFTWTITPNAASTGTIRLMWDANTEAGIAGYILHAGIQAGSYAQHYDVGLATSYLFANAVIGQRYCFAVSAYLAGPVEGPKSAEVCGYANIAPTLASVSNQSSNAGQPATLQLSASDPEGSTLTYGATGLPAGLTVTPTTGLISGTPTTAGSYAVTATVSDGALTSSRSFTWTVVAVDTTAPAVTITGPTSAATHTMTGTTVALSGTASDTVGVLQVTWANNRGGSGTATGTTTWTVSAVALQTGANVVTVTARDAAGNTASDVLTVTVNGAPTLTNPGAPSSNLAQSTSLQLAGSDPNGDTLTYSVTALPPGLSLTASNGLIAGTPVMTGSYPVTATVSDGTMTASQTFTWTITPNASASTGTIRLMWDANPEAGIAGYILHAGVQAGSYAQHYDVGLATSYLFANAVIGQRYCFAVSAYLAGPVEGPKSAEVCGYANAAPTLASVANQSSNVGQPVTLQLSGSDPESSTLTYGATGLPAGLAVTPATGLISGTPTTAGAYAVTATVSDGALTSSRSFTWTIVAVDTTAPSVTITGPTSAAAFTTTASTVSVSGTASDNVGVTQVTWTNDRGGSGSAAGTTTWNTGAITLSSGVNTLTVTARDAAGNVSTDVLTVTLNVAPALAAIAGQTSDIGQAASLQLVSTDANGDPLSYAATGLPPGLSLNASTGAIAGTPSAAGSYSVTATVSDGTLSASRVFTWTITPDTAAPVVAITAPASAGTYAATVATLTLSGTASDVVGVTHVSWVNSRGGSGAATGTSAWNVSGIALLSGQNVITVTARDAAGNTATAVITVTWNVAPTLASISDRSSEAGQPASVQLSGSDADGDVLTYGANGLPPGVALTVTTGVLSGTPTEEGTYTVTATVFDGAQSASRTFTWTVTADATAPVVAITAPTPGPSHVTSSATIGLDGWASDAVGVTQVSWVNSRGGSGVATGTTSWNAATVALLAGTNVITLTARDAAGNAVTDVLTVTYNVAPTLASVANQSTAVGQAATLQLSASDANNDTLSYSATGLPPGLSVAASTGVISGTSTTAGSYAVTASVSDGLLSTSRTFTWVTVAVDATSPTVAITGPTSAASYTASTQTLVLNGTAADNVGVTQVTWVNNRGGSGTATGTITWNVPAVALQSGTNVITVTARDAAGNTSTDVLTVTYATPLQVTSLTANRQAPQPVGTSITFTVAATGGTTPHQYKWRLYNGSAWVVLRDWNSSPTFTWTPTTASSWYRISVWARSSTSTADAYESRATVNFGITNPALQVVSLTSNRTAPQPVGSAVTFTATVAGGVAPHQYKWRLYNGSTWSTLQEWSTSNTFTWTPQSANANYRISVWVRNAGSTSDVYDSSRSLSVSFPIQ